MVRPERFELPTFWFVARRSIQLSYGRKFVGLLPIYRVGWYSASTAISRIRRPTCVAHKATYCHARTQMLSVPLSLRRATFVKGYGRQNSNCGGAYSNVACGATTLLNMLSERVRGRTPSPAHRGQIAPPNGCRSCPIPSS